MADYGALDASASNKVRRCSGLGVHTITIRARDVNRDLSDAFDNSPGNTWTHREVPIFIGTGKISEKCGSHRAIVGRHVEASRAFDPQRTTLVKGECGPRRGPRFHRFRAIGQL